MQEIRPLTDAELERFAVIAANAYPGMHIVTPDDHQRLLTRLRAHAEDPTITWIGLFRDDVLLGGMRQHDFTMNMRGATIHAGGVGMVAVDLLHKKEGLAHDLLSSFLRSCQANDWPLALLYPFRPDFYKHMGFGYGPKWSRYRTRPESLPSRGAKEHVELLDPSDTQAVCDCYARFMARTHGMIAKPERTFTQLLSNPERHVFGYRDGDTLRGYCSCSFVPDKSGNFLANDLQIGEFIYETPDALAGLLSFLRAQSDQVRWLTFDTPDANLHYLLSDPRNGTENIIWPIYHESNTQGVGLMYRLVGIQQLFTQLRAVSFGQQNLLLKLSIQQPSFPTEDIPGIVAFVNGHPVEFLPAEPSHPYDVELTIAISDFSSLVIGAVDFLTLHRLGLATLSNPANTGASYVDAINALFHVDAPPICTVEF